jgi:hypothetical protein
MEDVQIYEKHSLTGWWFGSSFGVIFHFRYGMSSFPLTTIFQEYMENLLVLI